MKTYFACSDIHSFYQPLIQALNKAGFEKDNPEHILIVCGDIFDRGKQPIEVYEFLKALPRERRFLIRGNHEYLFRDLIKRGLPLEHDMTNGTYNTLLRLNKEYYEAYADWIINHPRPTSLIGSMEWEIESSRFELEHSQDLYHNKRVDEIINWIFSSEWRNYLQLGKYIFVHSFVPKYDAYDSSWREASAKDWEKASWANPWLAYQRGYFHLEEKQGFTLVCGHWHTSDFYNHLLYSHEREKQLDIRKSNPIFKSEHCPGIIGLDACTVYTNKINVLVIKEDELGL